MNINELIKTFKDIYGDNGEKIRVFASPGRVNLIGEHIDYNGGKVLPAALTMNTVIAVRKTDSGKIRLAATDLPDRVEISLDNLESYKALKWGNYQAGIAYELSKKGYKIQSCDMLFDDTVPHGAGLSSSAAIEVSTALCLATFSKELTGDKTPVDMVEMALLSQSCENNYCGVNCGIMDQFASAMGKKDNAILLNCGTLEYDHIPLKLDGYKIVIANTNKKRSLADSKYNERRAQCEEALRALKTAYPDIEYLSQVTPAMFEEKKSLIKDGIVRNRAEHVVYECDRVLKSVEALKNEKIELFGSLINSSGQSLKDLYEVTGIELDTLVEEARKVDGCIGARMTGAGFGGCTVNIVKENCVDKFIEDVGKNYLKKIGYAASFYVSVTGDGGREIIL